MKYLTLALPTLPILALLAWAWWRSRKRVLAPGLVLREARDVARVAWPTEGM